MFAYLLAHKFVFVYSNIFCRECRLCITSPRLLLHWFLPWFPRLWQQQSREWRKK